MPRSSSERAARWLLEEIPVAADPTERGLKALAPDRYDKASVSQGLSLLRRQGLATKADKPFNPARRDRGNAWLLTNAGRAELAKRIGERAEYEVRQFRQTESSS